MVTRLINKALLGDIKAIAIVLQLDRQLQSTIDSITLMPIRKPTDEKVQASFLDRKILCLWVVQNHGIG